MRQLLVMDAHNYAENLEEICRVAVRAIIMINGKLLLMKPLRTLVTLVVSKQCRQYVLDCFFVLHMV